MPRYENHYRSLYESQKRYEDYLSSNVNNINNKENNENNENNEIMRSFNPRTDKLFEKTGDKILDAIIKFTIQHPYLVVTLTTFFIVVMLIIFAIIFNNAWLIIPMIIIPIVVIILSNVTEFADKFYDKYNYDNYTYYQEQYKYTEDLNKKNNK